MTSSYHGTGTKLTSENIDFTASSGSNANGKWIQFADGTMICYDIISGVLATTDAYSSLYNSPGVTLTFPQTFIAPPTVQTTCRYDNRRPWPGLVENVSTTSFSTRIMGTHSDTRGVILATAIGRWK